MNLLNKKNIIVAVSAIIVLGVGTFFYQQSCDTKEQAAKSALYQVQKTLETETATLSEAEKAAGSKFDVDAKFSKTVAALNGMLSSATTDARVKYEAGVKLGTIYMEFATDNQVSKSVDAFKKASETAKSSFQKASAFYLLGNAQERTNQIKEAAESFQSALNQNYEGLNGELLLSLVRVNLRANDPVKAKAFADKLSKDAPGSRAAQEAQKLVSKT